MKTTSSHNPYTVTVTSTSLNAEKLLGQNEIINLLEKALKAVDYHLRLDGELDINADDKTIIIYGGKSREG